MPLPIPEDTLRAALCKIGVTNARIEACSSNSDSIYIVRIQDNRSPCPLCAPLKDKSDPGHSSNGMWVVINTKEQTIHFSCYMIKGRLQAIADTMPESERTAFINRERYIKLDFSGDVYISDYDLSRGLFRRDDVQDIPDKDRKDISNDDLASHTRALKPDTLKRVVSRYDQEHRIPDYL